MWLRVKWQFKSVTQKYVYWPKRSWITTTCLILHVAEGGKAARVHYVFLGDWPVHKLPYGQNMHTIFVVSVENNILMQTMINEDEERTSSVMLSSGVWLEFRMAFYIWLNKIENAGTWHTSIVILSFPTDIHDTDVMIQRQKLFVSTAIAVITSASSPSLRAENRLGFHRHWTNRYTVINE